jgi:hypothetical protein
MSFVRKSVLFRWNLFFRGIKTSLVLWPQCGERSPCSVNRSFIEWTGLKAKLYAQGTNRTLCCGDVAYNQPWKPHFLFCWKLEAEMWGFYCCCLHCSCNAVHCVVQTAVLTLHFLWLRSTRCRIQTSALWHYRRQAWVSQRRLEDRRILFRFPLAKEKLPSISVSRYVPASTQPRG